jgi:hypothetical protein
MPAIVDLKEFIDVAEKNRKYAKETAKGKRAALRLFETELNEDEMQSVDLLNDRLEKIYQAVYNNNKTKMQHSSLVMYKNRLQGLLKDYLKYGNDPNAFTSWDKTRKQEPRTSSLKHTARTASRVPSSRNLIEAEVVNTDETIFENDELKALAGSASQGGVFSSELNRFEVFLRPGFKVSLTLPIDLNKSEADRIKHMIDGMIVSDGNDGIQKV